MATVTKAKKNRRMTERERNDRFYALQETVFRFSIIELLDHANNGVPDDYLMIEISRRCPPDQRDALLDFFRIGRDEPGCDRIIALLEEEVARRRPKSVTA